MLESRSLSVLGRVFDNESARLSKVELTRGRFVYRDVHQSPVEHHGQSCVDLKSRSRFGRTAYVPKDSF